MAEQTIMPGMKQKLNVVQKAAEAYIIAERESGTLKDRAKDRKEDMIAAAQKLGITTIKFTDDEGWTHTFDIDAHVKVKHTAFQAVRIEKVEKPDRGGQN
ncbi:MAG: hypothetical protein V4510_09815 [bacterium]